MTASTYLATIWLPFPPSVNNLFPSAVVQGRIRRFPSKQYRKWRTDAHILLCASRVKRIEVPVVVSLELTPRDGRPRDADNYCKPVLDALVGARILHDDSNRWVHAVAPYWCEPSSKEPGVIVRIRPSSNVKPNLSAAERRTLATLSTRGGRLVSPNYKPSKSLESLIAKGLVEVLPGLFPDAPQGFKAAV